MNIIYTTGVSICFILLILGIFSYRKTLKKHPTVADEILHQLLLEHVLFYKQMSSAQESYFRNRINNFLSQTRITKVNKQAITDLDRTLIGASAIIPIFNFPEWEYKNLKEVLLYPNTFNQSFETKGKERNILGMVGNGAMNRTMILSEQALYDGFHSDAKMHTAIHEFVHLIDMADGQVDGVPEYLIHQSLITPWLEKMFETKEAIKNNDINIRKYATVNKAEFLSVVSEYFFLRPQYLKSEDPELYQLLQKIYNS